MMGIAKRDGIDRGREVERNRERDRDTDAE